MSIYDWDYEAEPNNQPTEQNIESTIIKHWRENKSISEIVTLTKRTREEVIDIISEYIKKEMNYEIFPA